MTFWHSAAGVFNFEHCTVHSCPLTLTWTNLMHASKDALSGYSTFQPHSPNLWIFSYYHRRATVISWWNWFSCHIAKHTYFNNPFVSVYGIAEWMNYTSVPNYANCCNSADLMSLGPFWKVMLLWCQTLPLTPKWALKRDQWCLVNAILKFLVQLLQQWNNHRKEDKEINRNPREAKQGAGSVSKNLLLLQHHFSPSQKCFLQENSIQRDGGDRGKYLSSYTKIKEYKHYNHTSTLMYWKIKINLKLTLLAL